MISKIPSFLLCSLLAALPLPPRRAQASPHRLSAGRASSMRTAVDRLPILFEPEGRGRSGPFLSRLRGFTATFDGAQALFAASAAHPAELRLRLQKGSRGAAFVPEDLRPTRTNEYLGADPRRWRIGIPNYGRLRMRNAWPGVDVLVHGESGRLEYDFAVAPGADPRAIGLQLSGMASLEVGPDGSLVARMPSGAEATLRAVGYQRIGGRRRRVACRFAVESQGSVRIALGPFDRARELTIDPVVAFSTYLGGSGDEYGLAVAADSSGDVLSAGTTSSQDFPTSEADQPSNAGSRDVFVAKMNPAGRLLWSTYLGGSGDDAPIAIATDPAGNVYLTGTTGSKDFPVKAASQAAPGGADDVFVAKLDPGGVLQYSTYLGGSSTEYGLGIGADASGSATVTGFTLSDDFPVRHALQAHSGGGADAFVCRLSPSGGDILFSTYLGGSGDDYGVGVALAPDGTTWLTGVTLSGDFPTRRATQATPGGGRDAFVAAVAPSGSELSFSTYLGGSGDDYGVGLAIDAAGNPRVAGTTASSDFPVQAPLQRALAGKEDVFVASLDNATGAILYATYLGGAGRDFGARVALDPAGNTVLAGATASSDFPLKAPVQSALRGGSWLHCDGFVSVIAASGTSLMFSTYLGGSGDDGALAVAATPAGMIYVVGTTMSPDFPVRAAVQPDFGGGPSPADAFVVGLSPSRARGGAPVPGAPAAPAAPVSGRPGR